MGALGFSLLPRQMALPLLEKARFFLTLRGAQGGMWSREPLALAPSRARGEEVRYTRSHESVWETAMLEAAAVLWGRRTHQARGGAFTLRVEYRLHREAPLLTWKMHITAAKPQQRLRVERLTLLRVGPPRPVRPRGRGDFFPTRFRLFKLRRSPQTQSAYYNLTQRFGSLRLHALDVLPFEVDEPSAEAWERLRAWWPAFQPAHGVVLRGEGAEASLLLAVGPTPFAAQWSVQANTTPLAPGLTLHLQPQGEPVFLNAEFRFPPMILAWL